MEGVTILSEDMARICPSSMPTVTIIFLLMVAAGIIGLFISIIGDWPVSMIISSLIIMSIGLIMSIASVFFTSTKVKTYKVTIDDSVSFTEFTDKYEIKDQEGKIFTVYEKSDIKE